MRKYRILLLLIGLFSLAAQPGRAAKRELVQILQQVNNLQQQIQNLQQSVDRQGAVVQTLIEQTTDTVRDLQTQMAELKALTQSNLAGSAVKIETIATQIEILNASLEEAKARIGKVNEQMVETQNILQTLSTPSETTETFGETSGYVPEAKTLYDSAYRDFTSGQYLLAVQEFQEYLHHYGDTQLAPSAQYYIGDCYYNQGNFRKAIDEYNKALERYPTEKKLAASARLKKGYALLELKQKQAGVKELRSLIARFPRSTESRLARERLQKLGVTPRGQGL